MIDTEHAHPALRVDRDGQLSIGGCSVSALAEEFGTPLYVYDANRIVANYRNAAAAASRAYDDFAFFYAIKACNNLEIANLLVTEGAGIDAASVNEVRLAQALGLSGDKILFSGNFLSDEDLRSGLESGAMINLDDVSLLPRLLSFGTPEILSFRVNPGYGDSDVGEDDFVTNAGPDAKFGVHRDQVVEAYQLAKDRGVKRFGAHMMPGSNMREPSYFVRVTRLLMDILANVSKETGVSFEFIDLGGGLGIPYLPHQKPLDLGQTFRKVIGVVSAACKKHDMVMPRIMMEPGRYFVGDAGFVVGRVHSIKENDYGIIVGTDVSMNVFARSAMYKVHHTIYVDGRENDHTEPMGLCGQVCENTDFWFKRRELPQTTSEGDLVVVADAGAYGYAMSYEYNGRLRPAEVLVEDGKARLIRRAGTFSDMVGNMVLSPKVEAGLKRR